MDPTSPPTPKMRLIGVSVESPRTATPSLAGLRGVCGIVVDAGVDVSAGAEDVRGGMFAAAASPLDGPMRPIVTCT
jgi:hypothetical protein